MRLLTTVSLALFLALFLPLTVQAQVDVTALQELSVAEHRSADNRARNEYRNPVQTLTWLGLEPDMTVVEIWPGGGWYTEILAPYLREDGKYYAAGFVVDTPETPDYRKRYQKNFEDKLAASPALYDKLVLKPIGPPDSWSPAPAGSADAVLTFRNVHNWVQGGFEQKIFDSFFSMLKPGGVLGVVEHRADPGTSLENMKRSGYVTEKYVKELASNAGFELLAETQLNANPADDHQHPEGVWTLPPSLRLKEKDRAQYLAIGESDRMTLKFRKPAD